MKKSFTCLTLLCLFFTTQTIVADTYEIDPVHSQVIFTISHQGFSNTNGAMVGPAGTFEFDENDYSKSSVDVTLQSSKLDMDNATWKQHLSSVDWFNVLHFPTITFKSTKVIKTGDKTMDVTGDLTLLATTLPVTLKVKLNKVGQSRADTIAGFSATATIDRTAFGLDTFAPAIGAEVNIRIELEGKKI